MTLPAKLIGKSKWTTFKFKAKMSRLAAALTLAVKQKG